MKKCTYCGVVKPLTDYHRNKGTRDGRAYYCAECTRAVAKVKRAEDRAARARKP